MRSAFPLADAVPLLQDFLTVSAIRLPDKIALVCGEERVSYKSLHEKSNALAHALLEQGLGRGDRVVIYADNTVETAIAFWAVLKAGGVVIVANPQTKAEKLAYLLNDSRAHTLITDAHLAPFYASLKGACPHLRGAIVSGNASEAALAPFPEAVRWEELLGVPACGAASGEAPSKRTLDVDLAAIVYTSGSTGDPKGVMLTHRNMIAAATSVSSYLGMNEDDVVLNVLPFAFDYGLYQMIMAFRLGARLVLERSFTFPAQVLKRVAEEKVTIFPGVPTIFSVLEGMRSLDKFSLSSVRMVTNTAAALTLRNIEFLRRGFPEARIYSMYGLTECKRCSYLPPEDLDRKPLSVGIAIPNTEFWIEDANGKRLGPDEVGHLVIRGATVMKGYWEKPEETAKKLKPGPLPGEMVLHTGDLCRLDREGYLYFVARSDDIIKSRGEKIAPREVENVIHGLPGVREVAVVGVPDDILGQAVKAFVALEEGATLGARDILSHCSRHLEAFMMPKFVEIVPELPKTATGKIKKTGLG